jgi:GAF domain-containing protein
LSAARSDALAALSRFLVTDVTVAETLLQIAEVTVGALPQADVAGITMLDHHGKPSTNVFTDEASPEIDEAQYRTGRGPCLDAWRTKQVVRIDDMRSADHDYLEFRRAAMEHGVQSTLSFPLVAAGEGIGALNLYSRQPHGFSADDEALGQELATTASVVLANVAAYWEAFELGQQLGEAMQSRAIIEQAKGILMARSPDLDADGAFDLLRKASQRENVKLREVAERIVRRDVSPR